MRRGAKRVSASVHRLALWARSHWPIVLVILGMLGLVLNVAVFYPGYMSNDSMSQYAQAIGAEELGDWHPPILAIVWAALIAITGQAGSLLVLQLGMLWAAVVLLSVAVYRHVPSHRLSLIPFLLPLLPFVCNISGVLWKDVQMAYALLLALSLGVYANTLSARQTWGKVLLAVVAALLILYASLLRYNAFFAAIPILFIIVSVLTHRRRLMALSLAGFIGLFLLAQLLIGHVSKDQHPLSSVMLDDVVAIRSPNEIASMSIGEELKGALLRIEDCAELQDEFVNLYWVCADNYDRHVISTQQYNELQGMWLSSIFNDAPSYFGYRLQAFAWFVFSQQDPYIWHPGINQNEFGLELLNPRPGKILKYYVDASYAAFVIFFKIWFWLVVSVGLLIYALRNTVPVRKLVIALTSSAIIYILAYAPVVVAADYRYVYWSVLATLLALGCVLLSRVQARRSPRLRK